MNPIKIAIADDHPILVEGIVELLENIPDFQVLFSACNGEEMLARLALSVPDVAILDVNMPGMNGLECTRRIKEAHPAVKVIILTMYNERSVVTQLIGIGADGCLLKSTGSRELITAIRRVMENKSYYDSFLDFISKDPRHPASAHKLSTREEEIVRLVVKGLTSHEIAEKLFIAENTVKTHRKNILKKLGLSGTPQLTLYAINSGIV